MTCEQQKRSYYAYAIPESIHLINDVFSAIAKIEFTNAHAPLLLTAGRFDRLIPASLNYRNYKKYNNNNSITDYKEFEDHNHLVFDPSECLEEADFIVYWLEGIMH
jgi:pimeloyl-ACP methyl ester carboxylesterase